MSLPISEAAELVYQVAAATDNEPPARADIVALHDELHQTLRIVRKLEAALDAWAPVLDRFAGVAGSPAARFVRGRTRPAAAAPAPLQSHYCQGWIHDGPINYEGSGIACVRTGSHRWNVDLGCHETGPACNG